MNVPTSFCKGVLEKGNPDLMGIRSPKNIPNIDSKAPLDYTWNQKLQEAEHQKTNKANNDNL